MACDDLTCQLQLVTSKQSAAAALKRVWYVAITLRSVILDGLNWAILTTCHTAALVCSQLGPAASRTCHWFISKQALLSLSNTGLCTLVGYNCAKSMLCNCTLWYMNILGRICAEALALVGSAFEAHCLYFEWSTDISTRSRYTSGSPFTPVWVHV